MKTKIIYISIVLAMIFCGHQKAEAQEVESEFQARTKLDISFKPFKKVKLNFSPELRFDEDFSLDKYHFETELEYKPVKFLELGATYRFVVNPREIKSTEYFNRYAFNATAKKEFGRFEPAIRFKYSNYADDDVTDKTFMRYKASLKYDIKNCKITPTIASELFQQLDGEGLYKTRYSAGLDYKIFKKNYLGLSYKFDYYQKEYKNRHIISLGYKIKF